MAYNALPGQGLKEDFELWAAAEYPDLWESLQKRGHKSNFDGLKKLNIVRELKA